MSATIITASMVPTTLLKKRSRSSFTAVPYSKAELLHPSPTAPIPLTPADISDPRPKQSPAKLHEEGILTDEEFAAKKSDLLSRL